jgi:hypothetical protein
MAKDVKNGAKALVLALACLTPVATVRAETTYEIIASRNIFGLGQEQGVIPTEPPKLVTDVKLVGITTLGLKQALLTVNAPTADGKVAPHSVTLCEGQQFGGVEVLQINPAARSVKVRKDSVESTIYFAAVEPKK